MTTTQVTVLTPTTAPLVARWDRAQHAAVLALTGGPGGSPRSLAQAAALLQEEPETVSYQLAQALRAVLYGPPTAPAHALRLYSAFLCEDMSVSAGIGDGLPTFQRVLVTLYARQWPADFPRLTMVSLWSGGVAGQTHLSGARILAPGGAIVAAGEAALTAPGEIGLYIQTLYAPGFILPEPGRYTVELWLDGVPVYQYPLFAEPLPEPEEARDAQA